MDNYRDHDFWIFNRNSDWRQVIEHSNVNWNCFYIYIPVFEVCNSRSIITHWVECIYEWFSRQNMIENSDWLIGVKPRIDQLNHEALRLVQFSIFFIIPRMTCGLSCFRSTNFRVESAPFWWNSAPPTINQTPKSVRVTFSFSPRLFMCQPPLRHRYESISQFFFPR